MTSLPIAAARRRAAAPLRLAALVAILCLSPLGAGVAQTGHPDAPGSAPDVPAGPATLSGRVVHAGRPDAAGGVEVVLYALPENGTPGVRRSRADASGAFRFERISNDPSVAYLVGARYGDVPFPGERVSFQPGELERTIEVRIAEATHDPKGVSVASSSLRFDRAGARIGVIESHRIHNAGDRVVAVPRDARTGVRPAFRTTLPAGATDLSFPLGIQPDGVAVSGSELAFFGPIYPGDQDLSFSYALPEAAAKHVRKTLPAGAGKLVVLTPESGGIAASGSGLRAAPVVEIDDRKWKAEETGPVAPGATVEIALAVPPARTDPDAVSVSEVRIFVEVDGTTLLVREEHHLAVSGATPVVPAPGGTLLRIPLPDGVSDLRFAPESGALGLAAAPEGGLAVDGPLPAGASVVEFAYRLPMGAAPVDLARRFEKPVPLLSVFVADTGLLAESTRLHRRRPVRSGERIFMYLEAFDVGANETVDLGLSRLAPQRGPGGLGTALFVALAAAGAVGFLVAPLRGRGADGAGEEPIESASQRERSALYASLRDLEDDFETGKVSEEDFRTLAAELRARAALLLQQERAAEAKPRPVAPAAPPVARFCTACGAGTRPGDRFCASCGTRLEAGAREASA